MTRGKRVLIGLTALGVMVAAFPIAAQAQSDDIRPQTETAIERQPGAIERTRARITRQIEQRLQTLDRLTNKVANARFVTDEHEATLLGDYETASRILTAGLDTVAAAETLQELREAAAPVFESTLVRALLGPKTNAVVASDSIAGVTKPFTRIEDRLGDTLDRLAAAGVEVSEAQDDLVEGARLVADAVAIGAAVADTVVDLQPGDEIRGPLGEAKADLRSSRRLLGEAKASIQSAIRFIRDRASSQNAEA
jgi:hypothetical protein